MIDFERLKNETKGKWASIYYQLGIDVGEGKHKPCPSCGGDDRFRFDDKDGDGNYFCNQCGAGDGFSLVMKCLNINFPEAIKKVQSIIGGCEKMPDKKPAPDPRPILNKLWSSSTALTGSDPASKYLHSRGLNLTPDNVRYCEKCYNKELNKDVPALIARIQNKKGNPVSLHRIYLQDVSPKKKLMTGTESLVGCAIRLFMPGGMFKDDVLGIAEGLETACAAAQLLQVATWAAISTSIMESWLPPEGITKIIIYADSDANYAGQKAAFTLANKLYQKDLIVTVEMPAETGKDFNDILLGG